MLRVLITGAGGAAAIAVYKSLRHCDVEILMADMCHNAPGLYLVDSDARIILPSAKDPNYVYELFSIAIKKGVDLIIPTVDDELLPISLNKERFRQQGIKIAISSAESLIKSLDKYKLMQACDGNIPLAKYKLHIEREESHELSFPIILKPRSGSGSRGIHLVHNAEELESFKFNDALLIQEYLPGKEYSVDVYVDQNGHCIACVPRERIKVDSGVAVVSRTFHDEYLSALACRVMTLVGLTGVANIQFKEDDQGIPKLLEINPRFSGTMPLTVAAGANIPKMVIDEFNSNLKESFVQHQELGVVRYLEERYVDVAELAA